MVVGWPMVGVVLATTGLIVLGFSSSKGRPAKYLYFAIESGDTETLKRMLAEGGDPNLRVRGGPSLLETAVRRREITAVEFLLEYGADPNATCPGQDSALAIAAFRNQRPSATLLVNAGADPTTPNPGRLGGTPLSLAFVGGYERLCRTMLDKAQIDASMRRELEDAATASGNERVALLLVRTGLQTTSGEPAA